jgi:hypothetical protein
MKSTSWVALITLQVLNSHIGHPSKIIEIYDPATWTQDGR